MMHEIRYARNERGYLPAAFPQSLHPETVLNSQDFMFPDFACYSRPCPISLFPQSMTGDRQQWQTMGTATDPPLHPYFRTGDGHRLRFQDFQFAYPTDPYAMEYCIFSWSKNLTDWATIAPYTLITRDDEQQRMQNNGVKRGMHDAGWRMASGPTPPPPPPPA